MTASIAAYVCTPDTTLGGSFCFRAARALLSGVLPLLVVLVFGIIQFGLVLNQQQGLHAAAREGARLGSLPTTDAAAVSAAVNSSAGLAEIETITITGADGTAKTGAQVPCSQAGDVVVTVQDNVTIEIPLWGNPTITLEGRGEFRCET